jgi:hypothetical protein
MPPGTLGHRPWSLNVLPLRFYITTALLKTIETGRLKIFDSGPKLRGGPAGALEGNF